MKPITVYRLRTHWEVTQETPEGVRGVRTPAADTALSVALRWSAETGQPADVVLCS